MTEKHEPARDSGDPIDPIDPVEPDAARDDVRPDEEEPVGFDLSPREAPEDAAPAEPDTVAIVPHEPAARSDEPDTIELTEGLSSGGDRPAFVLPPASEGLSLPPDEPLVVHPPAVAEPPHPPVVPPTVVGGMSTTDWLSSRPTDDETEASHPLSAEANEGTAGPVREGLLGEGMADGGRAEESRVDVGPAQEGTGNDADFLAADTLAGDLPPAAPVDEPFVPTTPTLVGVAAPAMPPEVSPSPAADDEVPVATAEIPLAEPLPSVVDKPVRLDVEPSVAQLASVPVERDETVPLAAVAAGSLVASAAAPHTVKDPTDAEVFAHAHEDVAYREHSGGAGVVTRVAGVAGVAACAAGLAMMLGACAGLTPATDEALAGIGKSLLWFAGGMVVLAAAHVALAALVQKAWMPGAIVTAAVAVVALAVAGGAMAFRGQLVGFNVLSPSLYVAYAGGIGLVLAVVGGLFEHRRMREETHVLAAVFANFLAGAGGAVLYAVYQGWNVFSPVATGQ